MVIVGQATAMDMDRDRRTHMEIEIWSDIVCPWCYLGKRRLEEALERFEGRAGVHVVHRAFQLDPTRPIGETQNRRRMLMAKYGWTEQQAEAIDAQMMARAADDGLSYRMTADGVTGNTRQAHEVVQAARGRRPGRCDARAAVPRLLRRGAVDLRRRLAGDAGSGGRPRRACRAHRARARPLYGRRGGRRPAGARSSAPGACRSSSSTGASGCRARSRWRCSSRP